MYVYYNYATCYVSASSVANVGCAVAPSLTGVIHNLIFFITPFTFIAVPIVVCYSTLSVFSVVKLK